MKKKTESKENIALIKFEKRIIACFKDKFIIRSYSPVVTIGGGTIIDVNIFGKWKDNKNYSKELFAYKDDNAELVKLIIQNNKLIPYNLDLLSQKLGLSHKIIVKVLNEKNIIFYGNKKNPWLLTKEQQHNFFKKITDFINTFHKKNKYIKGVTKEQINAILNIDINLLYKILSSLVENNLVKFKREFYFANDFEIKINKEDFKIKNDIIEHLNNELFNTSNIKELASFFNYDENKVSTLLKIENNNTVIIINGVYIITKLNYNKLINIIINHFKKNDSLTVKDFKVLTSTSRKYAVPLLEYLDKEKITYRLGNERKKYK